MTSNNKADAWIELARKHAGLSPIGLRLSQSWCEAQERKYG
jgi:hypothetical protein